MRTRDENKEEAILQRALDMVVEEGFDGLSMQKLAKSACVSPATIYIYFKDKEDLLLQLHKRECNKYFAYILEGFDPEMDFATGLAVQWKRRARYVIDHPYKAHFMEHFSFTPLQVKSIKDRDQHFVKVMHQFVSKAIRNKELVTMPFEVYWSVAFSPLYSLVRFHKAGVNLAGEPFTLTDKMLMQTLSLVLKAFKP
jgi:AcrR family transcriptional regulator